VNLAKLIDDDVGTAGQLAEKNKNRLIVKAQENLGTLHADLPTAQADPAQPIEQCL
jgi:hypothetical protein